MKPTTPKPLHAPDGVLAEDWRLVRPSAIGGRVKCFGSWWDSPKLKDYVGRWVWVEAGQYWITWVIIRKTAFGEVVCYAGDHELARKDKEVKGV